MTALYEPLPLLAKYDIRLLKILPSPYPNEPLDLSLEVASLDSENTSYEGLSYTWGSPENPLAVKCNGHPVSVTRNLHSVLLRLRESDKARTFWIDAICINQQDLDERAAQVKIMLRIYKQASQVFANLGEKLEHQKELFALMFALDQALNSRENDTLPIKATDFESLGLPPVRSVNWTAWQTLLSRPYFTRLWVIQEFAVASTLFCLLGKTYFPWDNLWHLISRMEIHGFAEEFRPMPYTSSLAISAIKGKHAIGSLHWMRDRVEQRDPRKITDLLWSSRWCQATDPKDKIYGILGLATDVDVDDPDLEITYKPEESVTQLYIRVARYLIRSHRAAWVLYEAGYALHPRQPSLPSWVPDWSVTRAGSPLGALSNPANYHAADEMPPQIQLHPHCTNLMATGSIVGTITSLTSAYHPEPTGSETDAFFALAVCIWLRAAIDLKSTYPGPTYLPTKQPVDDAFWRTLIGAKTHTDKPASDSYAEGFAALLIRQRCIEEAMARAKNAGSGEIQIDTSGDYAQADEGSRLFRQALQNMMYTKRFARIGEEYFGILPGGAEVGDEVWLIAGLAVPFVVRSSAGGLRTDFSLIGECYLHGVMRGEALETDGKTRAFGPISFV